MLWSITLTCTPGDSKAITNSFLLIKDIYRLSKKKALDYPFAKVFIQYRMIRHKCSACNQRLCAVNYIRYGVTHYRSRCDWCIKKGKKLKVPEPRWKSVGYRKKPMCDLCGFRAKFSAQLMVYHMDGNLHNNSLRNLKTVCQNCAVEIKKTDRTWQVGDLEPDC